MIRIFVAAVALGLACSGTASGQEGGAAGAAERTAREPPPAMPQANPKDVVEILIDYPSIAIRRREQGDVRVSMCVNEKGVPRNFALVESSGSKALDDASLKGARGLRFRPGLDPDGNPVDWCDPPYVMTFAWRLSSR